jgi:uncharacterized protein YukE
MPRKSLLTATTTTMNSQTNAQTRAPLSHHWPGTGEEAIRAELKKLSARVTALEKLLSRIVRQKPVSERRLEKVLQSWSKISISGRSH